MSMLKSSSIINFRNNYYIEEAILVTDIYNGEKKKNKEVEISMKDANGSMLNKTKISLLDQIGSFKTGKFQNIMTHITVKKKSDPYYILKLKLPLSEQHLNKRTPLDYWGLVCNKITRQFESAPELINLIKKSI